MSEDGDKLRVVPRDEIARAAEALGPESHQAAALAELDRRNAAGDDVVFYRALGVPHLLIGHRTNRAVSPPDDGETDG
jgi:hypothetical protein